MGETNLKTENKKFERDDLQRIPENTTAVIYISCVDNVKSRFEIADILNNLDSNISHSKRPQMGDKKILPAANL